MNLGAIVSIGVAVVIVIALVFLYARVYRRNRSMGTPGIISRSRLTCPKCQKTFDFDYVPGASVTALRLGKSRYMSCPLCHQWSVFDLSAARMPVEPPKTS